MRDRIAIVDINTKKFKAISYKQYDENNILRIVITKNGEAIGVAGYVATVRFQLPSKKIYEVPTFIENNAIKVILTKEILSENGKVIVEVELCSGEQVITTFSMYLNVEKSINKEISEHPNISPNPNMSEHHYHTNKDVLDQISQETLDKISTGVGLDYLDNYQLKEDIELNTNNKTITGAINEINEKVDTEDCYYFGDDEPIDDEQIWFSDMVSSSSSDFVYDNPIIDELFACIRTLQSQVIQLQKDVEYLKIYGGSGGITPDIEENLFLLEDGGLFQLESGNGYLSFENKDTSSLVLEDGSDLLLENGAKFSLEDIA